MTASHDETVEKVALAIYEAGPPIRNYRWHDLTQITQGTFYKQARAAIAAMGDGWSDIASAPINEKAMEAAYQAAAKIRLIGSGGRLNDPNVSESYRERIRSEARAAVTAYLAALPPPPGAKP